MDETFKRKFPCGGCGQAVIAHPNDDGTYDLICSCGATTVEKLSPDIWEPMSRA